MIVLLLLGAAMLLLPRRHAAVTLLLMACFVGPAQRIVLATLDFQLLRILILVGWARLLIRGEHHPPTRRPLDSAVLIWMLAATIVFVLYHGTLPMLINRLGFLFDAFGLYFLFRFLLRDWNDVATLARGVTVISIPVAAAFLLEKCTGRNIFHVFGGVPAFSEMRDGTIRCQGAFPHPILAGAFWLSLAPLMTRIGVPGRRLAWLAIAGIGSVAVIIVCCASTTPLGAALLGVIAMLLFPLRHHLRWMIGGALLGLVCLQLGMTSPVWHLLARIDLVGGSTSWYRYKLIDEFLAHFGDWWLAGSNAYSQWWPWGLDDVTNQYVQSGLDGGLVTLLLFLLTIALAFHGVGRRCRARETCLARARTAWAVGVMLLLHAAIFIGVSYFGQITMLWYLTLALAAFVTPGRAGSASRIEPRLKGIGMRRLAPAPPAAALVTTLCEGARS